MYIYSYTFIYTCISIPHIHSLCFPGAHYEAAQDPWSQQEMDKLPYIII